MDRSLENLRLRLAKEGEIELGVKVSAGAKISQILGWMASGVLKIAVSQAPEKGKANDAIVELLAKELGLGKKQISIVKGPTSTNKVIKILG